MNETPDARPSSGSQLEMIHRLPAAAVVDRIDHLVERCRGRRVIHVGFADAGFRDMQEETGTWLHERLAAVAGTLIGVDIEAEGVEGAKRLGYEAYVADCRDPDQLRSLDLEPAEVIVAGEVIEHLDDPGAFLTGLHALANSQTELIVTTPNASGLVSTIAAIGNREINHPDHVGAYTWRTLTALLARHRWHATETSTYVAIVKQPRDASMPERLMFWAGRAVLGTEKLLGRLGAPFAADGLIVTARSLSPQGGSRRLGD